MIHRSFNKCSNITTKTQIIFAIKLFNCLISVETSSVIIRIRQVSHHVRHMACDRHRVIRVYAHHRQRQLLAPTPLTRMSTNKIATTKNSHIQRNQLQHQPLLLLPPPPLPLYILPNRRRTHLVSVRPQQQIQRLAPHYTRLQQQPQVATRRTQLRPVAATNTRTSSRHIARPQASFRGPYRSTPF